MPDETHPARPRRPPRDDARFVRTWRYAAGLHPQDPMGIECLLCGHFSTDPDAIAGKYCPACLRQHDDTVAAGVDIS
jgi:hypothetical protein